MTNETEIIDAWKTRKERAKALPKEKRVEFMNYLKKGMSIGEAGRKAKIEFYASLEILNDNIEPLYMLKGECC